jgi:hypothetical protein
MYKMIGADGRQYGPVSADQVREWITQGRANGHTRVLAEGATEWKMLSELPEFSAALGPGFSRPTAPPTPPAPASGGQTEAEAMAQAILARDYNLQIGSCISRGWDLVMSHFWLTVGATLLITVLSSVASSLQIPGLLLNLVLWSGLDWLFLKLARGQKAELSDAFAGFSPLFVPLMLFSLVAQVLVGVGLFLCILPGIYLTVAWTMFAGLLIMDKGLEFWPAMELSRKVVTRHWWVVFGLALVCLLLLLLGTLACIIGVVIALPVAVAAVVYAYEDIFGSQPRLSGQSLLPAPVSSPPAPEPPAAHPTPAAGPEPQPPVAGHAPEPATSIPGTPPPPAAPAPPPPNPPGPETPGGPATPPPAGS